MGSGATKPQKGHEGAEAPKLEVHDLETLVIELGKDGSSLESGTSKPISQVEQVFVVIDPRAAYLESQAQCLNDPKMLRALLKGGGGRTKLKVFVLVPTPTSSKAHLLNSHIGAMFLGHWAGEDHCFIRADDYYHNGDAIMKAMAEEGKRFYPKEEAGNMKAMVTHVADTLWKIRAWVHWCVGIGLEEGEVSPTSVLEKLGPVFDDESLGLPLIGELAPKDGVGTHAFHATEMKAAFLTFSEESAGRVRDTCGGLSDNLQVWTVTDEHLQQAGNDLDEEELGGIAGEKTAHPVFFAYPPDLVGSGSEPSLLVRFIVKWRECKPCDPMWVVLLDADVDAFKANLWLVPVVHQLIENVDFVIFATDAEAKDAASIFLKTKYPDPYVAQMCNMQMIPFPRLHFFTLGTAIGGAALEDEEIFLPAVTVGPPAGNAALPPVEKFKSKSPFFYQGFENHERVIYGADEFPGVSIITPAKLLCSIFSGVCEKLTETCGEELTWAGAFGEDFAERENMELVEASANLSDLCAEFQQYLDANTDEPAEE
mmetsp:Transcript_29986/g.82275  ORF Transcript_29986/g.82275 Transcript_29986/m.82275 type:complete len:540 (+) Transcript_29986:101-1720(+)